MKFVIIAYNEALENEIQDLLADAGIKNYTQWDKVHGNGSQSGPHLGTHIWPKHNNVLATAVEDNLATDLMQRITELRKTYAKEGVKAFLLPLEEMSGW